MTTLKELAATLDAAPGPSRELDDAVSFSTNWEGQPATSESHEAMVEETRHD